MYLTRGNAKRHRDRATASTIARLSFQSAYLSVCFVLVVTLGSGCGTTTNRIATEQLLMSDAVDRAIAQIDFQHLAGQSVFIDTAYIKPNKTTGFISSPYVISSLRQQLMAAGCLIQDAAEQADIIIEPRIGTLGADGHEVTFGIPKSKGISAAAAALSGSPIGILPEISLAQTAAHSGVAKIYVFAYDRVTRQSIWQSGVAKAESSSNSTWIFGIGPLERGSIYDQPRFAGHKIAPSHFHHPERKSEQELLAQESGHVHYKDHHVFRDAGPSEQSDPTPTQNNTIAQEEKLDQFRKNAAVVSASYEEAAKQN